MAASIEYTGKGFSLLFSHCINDHSANIIVVPLCLSRCEEKYGPIIEEESRYVRKGPLPDDYGCIWTIERHLPKISLMECKEQSTEENYLAESMFQYMLRRRVLRRESARRRTCQSKDTFGLKFVCCCCSSPLSDFMLR